MPGNIYLVYKISLLLGFGGPIYRVLQKLITFDFFAFFSLPFRFRLLRHWNFIKRTKNCFQNQCSIIAIQNAYAVGGLTEESLLRWLICWRGNAQFNYTFSTTVYPPANLPGRSFPRSVFIPQNIGMLNNWAFENSIVSIFVWTVYLYLVKL